MRGADRVGSGFTVATAVSCVIATAALMTAVASPAHAAPALGRSTELTVNSPIRGGGYDTVIVKKNGVTARYLVTALPTTKPAILRVKVGDHFSRYRLSHPGMGQAVELNIFKAVMQTPRPPVGCVGEYCPIQVWAFRPGKQPTLVLKSRWSQYT